LTRAPRAARLARSASKFSPFTSTISALDYTAFAMYCYQTLSATM
jgi:hypothetical protein